MTIHSIEVKTYKNVYACPKCKTLMVFDGVVLTSHPPLYPHTCPKCGYKDNLRAQYPNLTYVNGFLED